MVKCKYGDGFAVMKTYRATVHENEVHSEYIILKHLAGAAGAPIALGYCLDPMVLLMT